MPFYPVSESNNNGFISAGLAIPEPDEQSFDVHPPEGKNPEPRPKEPSLLAAAIRQNNILAGFSVLPDSLNRSKVITHMLIKMSCTVMNTGGEICRFPIARGNGVD